MGFKDFVSQNSSLLSKKAWRCIQNPNDYWEKMLRSIYCGRENFWVVKPKPGVSWVWRNMLHGRDLLKSHGGWAIGSGEDVSIAEDRWLASWEKVFLKEGCNLTNVQELIDPMSHSWKTGALRFSLQPISVIEAMKTPIGWFDPTNKLIWPPSKDGCYSVKYGYACLREGVGLASKRSSSSYIHSEMS